MDSVENMDAVENMDSMENMDVMDSMDAVDSTGGIGSLLDRYEASADTPVPEGAYMGEDGLLHCSECGEPMQARVEFGGRKRTVYASCKCDREKYEAREQQRIQAVHRDRVKQLRHDSMMSDLQFRHTFAVSEPSKEDAESFEAVRRYAEQFDRFYAGGEGLLLYGGVGNGKTYAAECAANALMEKEKKVVMTTFPTILTYWNTADGVSLRARLLDAHLLIIDDFGVERSTDFANEVANHVIDGRYKAGLPVIITSNIHIEQFKHPSAETERVFDRIQERCIPLPFIGPSRRKANASRTYKDMAPLLFSDRSAQTD